MKPKEFSDLYVQLDLQVVLLHRELNRNRGFARYQDAIEQVIDAQQIQLLEEDNPEAMFSMNFRLLFGDK